jgi:hypothetical protein
MLQFIGQKKCVCVWGGRGVKGYGALYATSFCSCVGLYEIGLCMVFNATFNNISVISWWSVLLVEETRVPGYTLHKHGNCITKPFELPLAMLLKEPFLIRYKKNITL